MPLWLNYETLKFLLASLLFAILVAAKAEAPTRDYESQLNIIGENTIEANYSPVFIVKLEVLGSLIEKDDYRYLYPEILDCMWKKESTRGTNMIGDSGRAIGHFQIWISIHPVTYECAMDYDCSSIYTAKMIHDGYGYLWTTYKPCLNDSAINAQEF